MNEFAWAPFETNGSAAIDETFRQWEPSPNPQDGGSTMQFELQGTLYEITFFDMMQTNMVTGRRRPIRRQAVAVQTTSGGCGLYNSSDMEMVLDRFRELEAALDKKTKEAAHLRERTSDLEIQLQLKNTQARQSSSDKQDLHQLVLDKQEELELWRQLPLATHPARARWFREQQQLRPRPLLVDRVQSALRALVPGSHLADSHCCKVRSVIVEKVEAVTNVSVWKNYCAKKCEILAEIQQRKDCPWIADIAPRVRLLQDHLQYAQLEVNANEVLLLHGTTPDSAKQIATQGFDDRLAGRDLYGSGLYLTTDFCKAAQYCKGATLCLFVARATLGHPHLATGPMNTHKRPPIAEPYGVPHDCIIAKPGIPNGQVNQTQMHWEFVVPSGQAYPELLVHFRLE